jgi:hypothetical protein
LQSLRKAILKKTCCLTRSNNEAGKSQFINCNQESRRWRSCGEGR